MMLQIHDAYIESANMLAESNPMAAVEIYCKLLMMLQIHDAYIESANMLAESNPMADMTPNDVADSRCIHRERQHAGGAEPDG